MENEKKYYLHRISHEWEVSYKLVGIDPYNSEKVDTGLSASYLSIGWSNYADSELLRKYIETTDVDEKRKIFNELGDESKSIYSLRKFLNFKKDDVIIVPMYNKKFAIYKVLERPKSYIDVDEVKELVNQGGKVDIGFVVKVEILNGPIPRTYAESDLISRMKVRQTTVEIGDIKDSVEKAIKATAPINIYEKVEETLSKSYIKIIRSNLSPAEFEKLIVWYMRKIGADIVEIPSKNNYPNSVADIDVVALFDNLGIVIQIQAKHHKGKKVSEKHAINQIKKALEINKEKPYEGKYSQYITVPWVISTAESISDDTYDYANEHQIRLIDGIEFAKMLINAGIDKTINIVKE